MVARLVHRYGTCDTGYPGARSATLDEVVPGCTVLFGQASSARAGELDGRTAAARALRDAAHLESPGEYVDFRRKQPPVRADLLDLGDLAPGPDRQALDAASREIVRRGGRPVLLGGAMDDALTCLDAALAAGQMAHPAPSASSAMRSVFISPGLDWAAQAVGLSGLGGGLALGTHDLVSLQALSRLQSAGWPLLSASACVQDNQPPLQTRLAAWLGTDGPVFVVLDMSCIDMGFAAGASGDNVGGLEPLEFLAVVEAVASRGRLGGAAIVNLLPERDPRGHSERLAAKALALLLGMRPHGVDH